MTSITAAGAPTLRLDTSLRPESAATQESSSQSPEDANSTALEVDASWQDQPVRLPTYVPSEADKDSIRGNSPPTTPIDDPIYLSGSKKHFGFSARQ
ncbi:hypothetical protein BGZ89_005910, partial [Linnemannia elongata]